MTFYANLGYSFKLPNNSTTPLVTDGSIVLSSAMPIHQLERRKINARYPHMNKRLFDPQLYLSGLDANQSPKVCAKLASYPWFGIQGLNQYISTQLNQQQWMTAAKNSIAKFWTRTAPSDPTLINQTVQDCIDFQIRKGFEAIVLPSPLTVDPSTNYDVELLWLDTGLNYINKSDIQLPVFATVALSDICVHYTEPSNNLLLDLILDTISARGVDGVYLVLEQGSEPAETRHCSSSRALKSILHMIHIFSNDTDIKIAVNFLGQFGLACEAAGADMWASGWYKSVYRLRLADKIGAGRAFPSYWSYKAVSDIHLSLDFDKLNQAFYIQPIEDHTDASTGLLQAAASQRSCNTVPNWQYRMSNVTSAREHYLHSCVKADRLHNDQNKIDRKDFVENWLEAAVNHTNHMESILGVQQKTSTNHIGAWLDAFRGYRADHNV